MKVRVIYEDSDAKRYHADEMRRIAERDQAAAKADQQGQQRDKARKSTKDQAARDQQRQTQEQERDQARADAAYVRAVKARARAEEQLARQKDRDLKEQERDQARADAAYVKAVQQKLRAEKQLEDQAKKSATAAQSQTTAVLKMVAGLAGLHSAEGTLRLITDHFDKIRQDAYKAAEDVLRMRGAVRELAALRGEMGKTGPTLAHNFAIATETLQTPEQVAKMQEAGLGIGELALEGPNATMSRKDFDAAMVAAGKMASLEGGPSEAYGAAVGQLALSSKGKITAEEMQAKLERLYRIQQPGGFKNMGQALEQYGKIQPLIQAGVLSEDKAMGLLSAFSTASPGEASTMVDQFVRMTMAGQVRARGLAPGPTHQQKEQADTARREAQGRLDEEVRAEQRRIDALPRDEKQKARRDLADMRARRKREIDEAHREALKVPGADEFEASNAYIKGLGLSAEQLNDPLAIGKAMAKDLEAQAAKDKNFNRYTYLAKHGFRSQEERDMAMLFGGLQTKGRLAKIEAAQSAEIPVGPAGEGVIDRRFAERTATDPYFQNRAAELAEQGAGIKRGLEREPMLIAQRAAFARLKAQGKVHGSFDEWEAAGWWDRNGVAGGYHKQVEQEADRAIRAERQRLGLPLLSQWQWDEQGTRERAAREVQEAGGSLTRGVADDMKATREGIQRLVQQGEKKAQQGNPPVQGVTVRQPVDPRAGRM